MVKRTAGGNLVDAAPKGAATAYWIAWDEFGTRVVLSGDGADPDALDAWFRAPDAAAAAEMAAGHLVAQRLLDEGVTTIDVGRTNVSAPQFRVTVEVWLDEDGECDVAAGRVEVLR